MTQQFVNAVTFRPEAKEPVFVDRIQTLEVWREDIGEAVDAVSLARLKRASFSDKSGSVLVPDDDEYLKKISWASRDLGPTIVNGQLEAASIVRAKLNGKAHIFLGAPRGSGGEMLWRVNTGLWGNRDEVFRVESIMRGGKADAPANLLFHGCFAIEGGEGDEVMFAEHASKHSTRGYLVSKELHRARWSDVVLWNGETFRVAERRTYFWANWDGFKLAVLGCTPDSGHILINDKGKGRREPPKSQKGLRDRAEEFVWSRRKAAQAKTEAMPAETVAS